jgi:hypothetical protein
MLNIPRYSDSDSDSDASSAGDEESSSDEDYDAEETEEEFVKPTLPDGTPLATVKKRRCII